MDFRKTANILIIITLVVALLVVAKQILITAAFSVLISILLLPSVRKFEKIGVNRFFSIIFTVIIVSLIFSLYLSLMTYFLINIYDDLPKISDRLTLGLEKLNNLTFEMLGLSIQEIREKFSQNISNIIDPAFSVTSKGVKLSILTIGNSLLVMLYTVLLLYYRKGIKRVILKSSSSNQTSKIKRIMDEVIDVVKGYFYGMLLVMLILAVLNSLSLWAVGVDYPYFWGVLAASLVIIPYVGTILGGTFPLLYSLATSNNSWEPIAIIIIYVVVQQIEGNIISPKIIGKQINLNMLTIIFAMLFGALIWGVSGIILAVPIVGIIYTIFINYDHLKPYGELLSSDIGKG